MNRDWYSLLVGEMTMIEQAKNGLYEDIWAMDDKTVETNNHRDKIRPC